MGRKRRNHRLNRSPLLKGNWKFTRDDRELIFQTYYTIGTYTGTGRKLGIPASSVMRLVKESDGDPLLQRVRARVLEGMSGRASHAVERVFNSITDDELKTENVRILDKNGDIKRVVPIGPGLRDKAYAVKVLSEQSANLMVEGQRLRGQSSGSGDLLLPDTLEAARAMLLSKMTKLKIYDMEFSDGSVGQRVKDVALESGITEDMVRDADEVEADYDELAPFD